MSRSLQPGTVVGRFRVVSLLGAGGMGEVYLARDESLDRSVALKILPPDLIGNDERLRRFVQEAKAASSLNHPHIVTIYEIGEADVPGVVGASAQAAPVHFIAMELVTGHTLRDLIHKDKTDLPTLLRYLAQVAEGLAKAHAAGIVHRDLKPENVMVTQDGFAKVLDFGLAKLTEGSPPGGAEQATALTATAHRTGEGVLLGTVGYMSPEQVQGRPVDHRSDIFSFGCILYEAATRQRPFTADSDLETLHKILKEQPPPVEELNAHVPSDVRRMIRRCLAKSPDQRLHSMKDLALHLAEIAEEYDTLSVSSGSGSAASSSGAGGVGRERTRWDKVGIGAAFLIGVVGLSVGGWVWLKSREAASPGATPFAQMEVTRLLSVPDLDDAALSSDSHFLAYTVKPSGRCRLVVRQIATGRDLDVVPLQSAAMSSPAFSPDGNYLFYTQDETNGGKALYQVSTLGGAPRRIMTARDYIPIALAVSPDGHEVALLSLDYAAQRSSLVIANVEGTAPRTLTTFERGQYAGPPAWAPDGQRIVAAVFRPSPGAPLGGERLVAFSAKDGTEQPLNSQAWGDVSGIAWLPDGSTVVVAGSDVNSDVHQLWLVSSPRGAVRRITNDTNDYADVSVSGDGAAIAAVSNHQIISLWTARADTPEAAARVPGDDIQDLVPVRNGDILFMKSRSARSSIWRMAPDGSAQRQVTPERLEAFGPVPAALADVIVFNTLSQRGERAMWRMDSDGSGLAEIPGGVNRFAQSVSPDGKTVFFTKSEPNVASGSDSKLWKMPVAGGAEEVVAETKPLAPPLFSPDGKHLIRYSLNTENLTAPLRIEVLVALGERPLRTIELPADAFNIGWAYSSDALTYVRLVGGSTNIWRQPIDGRAAQAVTHFPPGQSLNNYAWTADGSRLFFNRFERGNSEVLLIKNFR